jgi:hypothetical protein
MASWSYRDIRQALTQKGFETERTTNHIYYRFHHQGKKTSIRTKVSHGTGDVSTASGLFRDYKRQLRLSTRELERFFSCPMSGAEYARLLLENEHVKLG